MTDVQLKHAGLVLASEVEDRIKVLTDIGVTRQNAIMLTVALMSEKMQIIRA